MNRRMPSVLLLCVLLTVMSAFPAHAARNPRINPADLDFAALIGDAAGKGTANVYHWWTAGGEKDAIESIINEFDNAYPEILAKSNAIPGGAGGAMVMKVKVLQQAGKSPEAFQAHPGEEIEPYLKSGMLLDLGKIWEYADIENRLMPGLSAICTASDGGRYIIPVGIHKTNVIFYNIHVFEQYGVPLPQGNTISWEDFWALCEALQAALPEDHYPIDLGDRKGWPACQVFENIMLGTSPQLYEDFINGNAQIQQVQGVLNTYKGISKNLMQYSPKYDIIYL